MLGGLVSRLQQRTGYRVDAEQHILADMTFRQWCEKLGADGLKVDGHPFTLANRRALWAIYDEIPTTIEAAYGKTLALMKGAQMGLTVFELLADIYMAIKFAPCKVLMYLPDRTIASHKSTERFMPIVRSAPDVLKLLSETGQEAGLREGNKLTRSMPTLASLFLFLWTSGKAGGVSESFPGDVLSLDELQGMTLEQIDRVRERLGASRIKFELFLSTPLFPDTNIHVWYLAGTQFRFHTRCQCADGVVLTDVFVEAALTNNGKIPVVFNSGEYPDAPRDYVYYCPECGSHIPDPQVGEWRAKMPEATIRSYHMSQILSPTISPRELITAYGRADNADRKQNFFCRKLGTPYADPSQIPVTFELLRQCVEEGAMLGVKWKKRASGTVLGIDQMGGFICAIVAERLPNGKMAIVHVEAVYGLDPWARMDAIMAEYGVQIAVAEQLPNIDSARQFAKRHEGRVFLITAYSDMEDMVAWHDVKVTRAERRTEEEFHDRYTVTADQYRILTWAFARIATKFIVFPDPQSLTQEIREAGARRLAPILQDMVFLHFTRTALVLEEDDEVRKVKRKVVKVGLDPHFSFSLLAVCVGWFRAHGSAGFILPEAPPMSDQAKKLEKAMPGLPPAIVQMVSSATTDCCGRCSAFDPDAGMCTQRNLLVQAADAACPFFSAKE